MFRSTQLTKPTLSLPRHLIIRRRRRFLRIRSDKSPRSNFRHRFRLHRNRIKLQCLARSRHRVRKKRIDRPLKLFPPNTKSPENYNNFHVRFLFHTNPSISEREPHAKDSKIAIRGFSTVGGCKKLFKASRQYQIMAGTQLRNTFRRPTADMSVRPLKLVSTPPVTVARHSL